MRTISKTLTGALFAAVTLVTASAQESATPTVKADPDGTLHWGPRVIPPAMAASPEARAAYVSDLARNLSVGDKPPTGSTSLATSNPQADAGARRKDRVLEAAKLYPANIEDTEIAGVPVAIYTGKEIAPRNKHRVAMEFEIDPEGVMLASIGKMRVISVHYSGPLAKQSKDIVAVYKELLKTYKPAEIAMYGISGGCQLAANTTIWLSQLKMPMPGALGLMTCAGGRFDGDSRHTNNGLDPQLSDFTAFARRRRTSVNDEPAPGDAPLEILNQVIPSDFPPSYLLAGTRDMCLSETVLLHRKLRHAGITADLNIFEGMWHAFSGNPDLPEARDAIIDLARFFDRYLET